MTRTWYYVNDEWDAIYHVFTDDNYNLKCELIINKYRASNKNPINNRYDFEFLCDEKTFDKVIKEHGLNIEIEGLSQRLIPEEQREEKLVMWLEDIFELLNQEEINNFFDKIVRKINIEREKSNFVEIMNMQKRYQLWGDTWFRT